MSAGKNICMFAVVFWGRWHTDAFARIELPSLLSPQNLPALAADHQITFRILTTRANRQALEASRAFAELQKIAEVTVIEEEDFSAERRFPIHHRFWNDCIALAREQKAKLFLLPPDLCFSDGSMKEIGRRLDEGKAAVYVTGIRVASETFIPDVGNRFYPEQGAWKHITWRDLDALTIEHSHPFNNAIYRQSPRSPHIAEMILYPVGSAGWVKQCYVAGPIMFLDPSRATMTSSQVVTAVPEPDGFDVVYDGREAGFVSLTPMGHYGDWYVGDGVESEFRKAWKQGFRYKSLSSDVVAKDLFRLGGNDTDRASPAWMAAEAEAHRDADRIRTRAMLVELADACHRHGLASMMRLLGLIAVAGEPTFTLARDVDYMCILPDDDRLSLDQVEGIVKKGGVSAAVEYLARRIYRRSSAPNQVDDLIGAGARFESAGDRVAAGSTSGQLLGVIGNLTLYRQTSEEVLASAT